MEFCMQHWFVSDLHFYHKKICQYANRPFDNVDDMNEALIRNWNSVVSMDDSVYCLGDFFFTNYTNVVKVLNRLNYRHLYIINGNHDKVLLNNRTQLLSEIKTTGNKLVTELTPVKECYINNEYIYMHHYSCRVWNRSHYGSWHLYGHSHGSLPPLGKSVDVGVDAPFILGTRAYRPYSFHEIQDYMKNRTISSEDYHGDDE